MHMYRFFFLQRTHAFIKSIESIVSLLINTPFSESYINGNKHTVIQLQSIIAQNEYYFGEFEMQTVSSHTHACVYTGFCDLGGV